MMNLVAGDLNNEDARRRVREGEGASISWIIGHLLDFRCQAMNLFGAEKESEYKEMFGNAAAGDGSNYPDISALHEKWNELSNELEAVLQNVSDEQLTAPIEGDKSVHSEKSVLDVLVFYMWHESYHMGSLGMVRKELGYPATAELAVAAASNNV